MKVRTWQRGERLEGVGGVCAKVARIEGEEQSWTARVMLFREAGVAGTGKRV